MRKGNFLLFVGLASAMMLSAKEGSLIPIKIQKGEDSSEIVKKTFFTTQNLYQKFSDEIIDLVKRVPDKESNAFYLTSFNFGDDVVANVGYGDASLVNVLNRCDYEKLYQMPLWIPYTNAWECINHINILLSIYEGMDKGEMTDEEKDLTIGQLLFWRAWWHEEMMMFFGGMPYLDSALHAGIHWLPRLSFKDCAKRCAEDFQNAVDLLPNDWEKITCGKEDYYIQYGYRVTKSTALAYKGKILLWAASPYSHSGENYDYSKKETHSYDESLAEEAAKVLGKVIDLIEKGGISYSLASYNYKNIYDHIAGADVKKSFSEIFCTNEEYDGELGAGEAMLMIRPLPGYEKEREKFLQSWGPKMNGLVPGDTLIFSPTANYINYAYGMANGQPIYISENLNPESGWNPEHPFKDRDPRFYHDIVFDGCKYVSIDGEELKKKYGATGYNFTIEDESYRYCCLSSDSGANMRDPLLGSRTGYFCQKLVPHQYNKYDIYYTDKYKNLSHALPYLRVADVYLMYSEAVAAYAVNATDLKSKNICNISAIDAINKLRDRVNSGDYSMERVPVQFLDTREHFLDEVRRERACELAFEGGRWCDLQRWGLLKLNTLRTSQEFFRKEKDDWFMVESTTKCNFRENF